MLRSVLVLVPFALALGACAADPPPGDAPRRPADTGSPTDSAPITTFGTPTEPTTPTPTEPYVMYGFSFVDEHVAGMPQPGARVPLEQDLAFLVEQRIALLVSLTEVPTDPEAVAAAGLDLLHLPIVDFTPPTYEQQVAFVEATLERVARDEKVGVHDTAGFGRCGTMLATWFVAKGMDAETAIATIRKLRPGSIETEEQEQSVYDFDARWGADTGTDTGP